MADFSSLSDAELQRIYGGTPSPASADLAGKSDEELLKLYHAPTPVRTWGDTAADAGRFAMTAGVRGLGGALDAISDPLAPLRRLVSPGLERLEQSGRSHPGQALGDAAFDWTGVPEYKPTTPLGRVGLSAAEGGVGGGPFGAGIAALSALGGALGQGTQEATGSERLATLAQLSPGLVAGGAAMRQPAVKPPGTTALRDAGSAGYDALRATGSEYDTKALSDLAVGIQNDITRKGAGSDTAPTTHSILDKVANPQPLTGAGNPSRLTTINDIMAIRENLGGVEGTAKDQFAAGFAKRAIDDFLGSTDPRNVTAGGIGGKDGPALTAAEISQMYRDANANYSAAQRSNLLTGELSKADTGIIERANNQADTSGNFDNAIRQRARALIQSNDAVGGFTPDEISALRDVNKGGFVQNRLADISRVTGGGRSMGSGLAGILSAMASAPYVGGLKSAAIGASLPVAGALARALENSMSRRAINRVDEGVRSRSPLYEEMLAAPQPSRAGDALRGLLPILLAPQPRSKYLQDY